jgi:CMP-2-keto-3-deoxyoctulosonic acid synthetase
MNLDDLGNLSITDMSNDEQLELLRQIRLQRRVPVKQVKTVTSRKTAQKVTVNVDQAEELLKLLKGN